MAALELNRVIPVGHLDPSQIVRFPTDDLKTVALQFPDDLLGQKSLICVPVSLIFGLKKGQQSVNVFHLFK
ncbi:hypothetical protein STRDD11_01059 [Streptococcus sp. DD11]|nr:hypothetical protein STRDD11_01059 [Streptococcus sp. DD11]